jgi:hypothetical protein
MPEGRDDGTVRLTETGPEEDGLGVLLALFSARMQLG